MLTTGTDSGSSHGVPGSRSADSDDASRVPRYAIAARSSSEPPPTQTQVGCGHREHVGRRWRLDGQSVPEDHPAGLIDPARRRLRRRDPSSRLSVLQARAEARPGRSPPAGKHRRYAFIAPGRRIPGPSGGGIDPVEPRSPSDASPRPIPANSPQPGQDSLARPDDRSRPGHPDRLPNWPSEPLSTRMQSAKITRIRPTFPISRGRPWPSRPTAKRRPAATASGSASRP